MCCGGARIPLAHTHLPSLGLGRLASRVLAQAVPTCLCTSRGLLQGHPFNAALTENRAMVNTLQYGSIGFTLLVLDLVPGFNGAMSLARIRHQRHSVLYDFQS